MFSLLRRRREGLAALTAGDLARLRRLVRDEQRRAATGQPGLYAPPADPATEAARLELLLAKLRYLEWSGHRV